MPRLRDRFACTPAQFWAFFLDSDYQRRLHIEGLGFNSYRVLERTTESWRVHAVPTGLPRVARKVLGDGGYIEEGRLDGGTWRFDITPDTLGDRIHTRGELWVEEEEGQAVRLGEITVTVLLPGIGGPIRKALEALTDQQQRRAAAFTKAWVRDATMGGEERL